MPCYSPMRGIQSRSGRLMLRKPSGLVEGSRFLTIPCGKCVGCLSERARQWSIRLFHESLNHRQNSFVTLTYEDRKVPQGGNLVPGHLTDFIRSLRKVSGCFSPSGVWVPYPLRFYGVGEYGGITGRPHYHALLFGIDFPDKVEFSQAAKSVLYTSKLLSGHWKYGHSTCGSVEPRSAAYVAQYCVKKLGKDDLVGRVPEFSRMSLKPGIGRAYCVEHEKEFFKGDCVMSSRRQKLPRYYDNYMRDFWPQRFERYKLERLEAADRAFDDSSSSRLRVREEIARARLKFYG